MDIHKNKYRLLVVDRNGYWYEYVIQERGNWFQWNTIERFYDIKYAEMKLRELNSPLN